MIPLSVEIEVSYERPEELRQSHVGVVENERKGDKMQRMILIPVEQYDRMVESFDRAVDELMKIKDFPKDYDGDTRHCLNGLLERMDEEQLEKIYFLAEGIMGVTR